MNYISDFYFHSPPGWVSEHPQDRLSGEQRSPGGGGWVGRQPPAALDRRGLGLGWPTPGFGSKS